MIFTVEHNSNSECVEIFLDNEGIEFFLRKLNKLHKNGGHTHFMTPSWAGYELTEERQGNDNELINHLKVYLKKGE